MTHRTSRVNGPAVLAVAVLFALPPTLAHAQVVRSDAGIGTTNATAARDLFRSDIGGGTVPGTNGSFGGLRREINWDGVPASSSTPNNLAANFFNTNSPRGVVFSTPGTGFQVSGAVGDVVAAVNFGNINPQYSSVFSAFSAQRLFTPIGSNITDVTFFVAGTTAAGLTSGFGSIFSDVDLANVTSLQFFDAWNGSLGSFMVPNVVGATAQHFSFLGVSFATPIISRVRITTGNAALDASRSDQNGNLNDLVVMDDFLYGEVVGTVVPEPATWGMLAFGLGALGLAARRRRLV
ncbi:PEP-CTERM sorting domain-containing protein [Gemmatimonas sp.]|uniref:PEP-CTERM sorting domain-containing protein n=1 Tax=Gemmatimonas sp. TaxID=1962908 RepID=UPI003983D618